MMMPKKDIYCISGLGADHRIFENLTLPDSWQLRHLPWISPKDNESIEGYAARMASDIADEEPIILGVSFGGMISVEMNKQRPVKQIFLVSSIKSRSEKPFYMKAASSLHLNKILPLKPYGFLEPIENYNLGVETEEEKVLAREYREHLDLEYSDWAIERILHWQNENIPENLIHIHGSKDHIFPIKYVRPNYIIENGGHLMIHNRAHEISQIIVANLP